MDDQCRLVFHALADNTRMKILEILKEGELCVSDVAKHFNMTQPSISHHLDILKRAGLVTTEKRGREVYYRLLGETIIDCCGNQFKVLGIAVKKL